MRRSPVPLLLSLAIYFSIGLLQLDLPGLQYDEAADAVPAMELLQGKPPSTLSTITILGRSLPLMMLHHIGPTSVATSWAGFAVLGVSVESLRVTQLCVGAMTLILLWLLARAWFGLPVAALATLACSTHPAIIWWSRAGANWTVPLLPLALGFMLALTAWWRTRKFSWLALAAFIFGAGIMTKILFIWLLVPLAFTMLMAQRPAAWARELFRLGALRILALAIVVNLGALPLVIHNVPDPATVRFILSNATQTGIYGHDNLNFVENLRVVISQWLQMIGGDTLYFDGPPGVWQLGAIAWVLAMVVGIGALLFSAGHRAGLPVAFLVLAPLTVLPMSTVSTSSIGATYVFMLVPFAILLMTHWAVAGLRIVHQHPAAHRCIAAILIAATPINQLVTNLQLHSFFARTGGVGWWSDAVYALNRTLQTNHADRRLVALDWGFARNLQLLSAGALQPREIFEYAPAPPPNFEPLCIAAMHQPGAIFIAHAPQFEAFAGRVRVCERAAFKLGMSWTKEESLVQRDGLMNTVLYSAKALPILRTRPPDVPLRMAGIGDGVTLLGGAVSVDPESRELMVRIVMQARRSGLPDDVVLVHVVSEDTGRVVQVADQKPRYGLLPFTQWSAGDIFEDRRWIQLTSDLPSGNYQVRVGLYDAASGARRAIIDSQNDAAGDSLRLQSFVLP